MIKKIEEKLICLYEVSHLVRIEKHRIRLEFCIYLFNLKLSIRLCI